MWSREQGKQTRSRDTTTPNRVRFRAKPPETTKQHGRFKDRDEHGVRNFEFPDPQFSTNNSTTLRHLGTSVEPTHGIPLAKNIPGCQKFSCGISGVLESKGFSMNWYELNFLRGVQKHKQHPEKLRMLFVLSSTDRGSIELFHEEVRGASQRVVRILNDA